VLVQPVPPQALPSFNPARVRMEFKADGWMYFHPANEPTKVNKVANPDEIEIPIDAVK
jgi:hypothetical protein